MRRFVACSFLVLSFSPALLAQQLSASGQPPAAPVQEAAPSGPARWLDLQAVNLAARYRRIETSAGVVASDEVQDTFALRARFKVDEAGRLTANLGVGTGGGTTSGWNSTGIGSGQFSNTLAARQLYAAVTPLHGLMIEYGGLAAVRGETTEVTNFDNDTYLVGGRVSVRRPDTIWLDEATVSLVYLGDPLTPSVFRRLHRLSEVNYRQYLVAKSIGRGIGLSAEYDRYLGNGTIRTAVTARSTALRVIDMLRFEQYSRLGEGGASGFGLYGEKRVVARLVLSGGYADIDPSPVIANGDRYLRGRRLYTLNTLRVTADMSVAVYFTQAVATDFPIANRRRGEIVVSYNALGAVQRAIGLR